MYFKRFYDENLAHASYLVGCQATGEAIVIDAGRHPEPYLEVAQAQGLKITAATETHIHADYLSGTRELAERTGARMYLSAEGGPDWQYQFAGDNDRLVKDGDVIKVGNLTLKVMHTPGHTPEHISFILTDHPATDTPMGAFTGDFMFVGDVGRPDLLEKAAGLKDTMRKGAVELFHSLQRFAELPDTLQIWPAHGAGSACGKALGAVPGSVLGYEKKSNWALRIKTESEFVEAVLSGQPEPPKYFAQMKKLNKIGPPLLPRTWPPVMDASAFKEVYATAAASRHSVEPSRAVAPEVQSESTLIDLRGAEAFAAAHPRGALFLPNGGSLPTWAGWFLSYEEPFYLLVTQEEDARRAIRALRSIGLDQVAGIFTQETFAVSGVETESSQRMQAEEVDVKTQSVLDVRGTNEWNQGHLAGADHIPLGYLMDRLNEVPSNPVLYCGSGVRSLIGSSLLQRAGMNPRDILGGYQALKGRKEVMLT